MAGSVEYRPLIITPELDEINHVYRVPPGIVKPGLHEILAITGDLPDFRFVDEWYRNFGKHGHRMIELYVRGQLDEGALDPQLVPVLDAFKRFLKETGCQIMDSEVRLWSQTFDYCTTIDLTAKLFDRFGNLEIKITNRVDKVTEKQLSGQDVAWEDNHPDWPFEFKHILQITRAGAWKLVTRWTNSPKQVWLDVMRKFWKVGNPYETKTEAV